MPIDTFADYWYRKQRATPSLVKDETKLTISVESLKAELKKAFIAGKLAGQHSPQSQQDPMADFLKALGGK